jgi:hypothetical protein
MIFSTCKNVLLLANKMSEILSERFMELFSFEDSLMKQSYKKKTLRKRRQNI